MTMMVPTSFGPNSAIWLTARSKLDKTASVDRLVVSRNGCAACSTVWVTSFCIVISFFRESASEAKSHCTEQGLEKINKRVGQQTHDDFDHMYAEEPYI